MCVARLYYRRRSKFFAEEIQGTTDPGLDGAEGLPKLRGHFGLRIAFEIGEVDNPTLIDAQFFQSPAETPGLAGERDAFFKIGEQLWILGLVQR